MIEKRSLTTLSLTLLGINAMVGSGIFLFPGVLAQLLGPYSILVFLGCGVLLSFVAITFSSLSTLTSRNGGPYLYAAIAFNPRSAFIVGWSAWVCAVVSCGAVGNAIGSYLSYFFPQYMTPAMSRFIAGAVILSFGLINYFGLRYGNSAMMFLTALKMLPLIALAGVGFGYFLVTPVEMPIEKLNLESISKATLLILFTCQGFEAVPILAGETKHPENAIPRAIRYSLWISLILYCLLQLGICAGPAVGSQKPLADQAFHLWGAWGGKLIAFTGVISVIGFVAGVLLSAPRFLIPLCEDNLLPKWISSVHPKYLTPTRAIVLTTGCAFLVATQESLESLLALSAFSVAFQYLTASVSLLVIARKFRTRHVWVASLSLLVSLVFLVQVNLRTVVLFAASSLVGIVIQTVYVSTQKKRLNAQHKIPDLSFPS